MSTTGKLGDGRDQEQIGLKGSPERTDREQGLLERNVAAGIELVEITEIDSPSIAPAPQKPRPEPKPRTKQAQRSSQAWLTGRRTEQLLVGITALLCFMQRPGLVFTDSRSDLTSNPGLFLGRVFDVWSSTYDLGHVQSGQFVGYLFPLAPFYAAGDAIGVPTWLVQRLWLVLILGFGAIGVSRLIAALWNRSDSLARLLGGLVFVLNPYVVTQMNRGTITLLAYMVAPWLMVAAHRALLEPRRWRWPIFAGILVAAAGGGVNAAVLAWVVLAPVLLIFYEVAVIGRSRRAAAAALWRTGITVLTLSLWWIIPVTLQSKYGADFLSFTEQPASIWQTNSVSESLRLLGYWISYFTIGFGGSRPVVPPTVAYLFQPILVAGSFAVPLLAFAGLPRIWRKPYVPFFVLLLVGAAIAMSVGFPPGKPLYRALVNAYYAVPLLQILRTTYKAAPLLSIALSFLVGAGGATLYRTLKGRPVWLQRSAFGALFLAPVLFGWPLITGQAIDSGLAYRGVPSYWRQATSDLDRTTQPGYRSMILPGQQFGFYSWGGTFDPVGPSLTESPLAQRYSVRYSDPHSSQLMTAVDNLVQQRRLVPGQLGSLLRLLGVKQVLISSDGKPTNSGEIDPVSALATLRIDGTLKKPVKTYGPTEMIPPAIGRGGNAAPLPAIRRYAIGSPNGAAPGLVRAHSRPGSVVVSGDANAITELAALGLLPKRSAILFSGDQTAATLRERVKEGASLYITDTNRRQTLLASRTTHDQGAVRSESEQIAPALPSYDGLFGPSHDKQTVAVYTGIDHVTNPEGAQLLLRPEARPFAAIDGYLQTTWTPASFLPEERRMEIGLKQPTRMSSIRIHPHRDALVQTNEVAVSLNGGPEQLVPTPAGWTRFSFPPMAVKTIGVRITKTATFGGIDLGGIDEIEVPGLKASEWLRSPVWLSSALAGSDLSRTPVGIILSRQTTSDPYHESGAYGGPVPTGDPQATFDAERDIRRIVSVPVSRSFTPSGWASSAPWAPDSNFDRLAGLEPGWTFSGSARFEGLPLYRASSAFDGDRHTAWISENRAGLKSWLEWRSPYPTTFDRLRLVPDSPLYARATAIRLKLNGLSTDVLRVAPDGSVKLPQPVTTDNARIEIVDAKTPHGIAGLRLLPAVAIQDVIVPGLGAPAVPRAGSFQTSCGEVSISSSDGSVATAVSGTLAELDRGQPLRITPCGSSQSLSMFGGPNTIVAPAGPTMRIDHLQLSSQPESPPIKPVYAATDGPNVDKDGFARVHFGGPGWLVRGESMSLGWTATCGPTRADQRTLGTPQVVDGFAAGWEVGPWCKFAKFNFAPQAEANNSYFASALATILFLAALAVGVMRTRRRRLAGEKEMTAWMPPSAPAADRLAFASRGFAAVAPLLAGSLAAALFALRVGPPVALMALFLGLWGVNVRRLYLLALAAMALVPIGYLAFMPKNGGGGNFFYAVQLIGAHWFATAAIILAASGATLTALRIRWSTHPRAGRISVRKVVRKLHLGARRAAGG